MQQRKFTYGPGLPGYGTKGSDGSTGLIGVATYFSAYEGNSDSVTIKGKIIANKELFSNDDFLPGYPVRVYQTGDIFIDKNARVFQIDFSEANLYKDTGIYLNTSGFFTEGPTQVGPPGFTRYSNSFEVEKFLIDTVYTNIVGDYTQYPTTIYNNPPKYFANVKYVGDDITADVSDGIYPFHVWTIGSVVSEEAIGLMRENANNVWHWGNLDDAGVVRDVSLSLDFKDIYSPGNIYNAGNLGVGGDGYFAGDVSMLSDLSVAGTITGTFVGSITTNSLHLSEWLRVDQDTSIHGDLFVSGVTRSTGSIITPADVYGNDGFFSGQVSADTNVTVGQSLFEERYTYVSSETGVGPFLLTPPRRKYVTYILGHIGTYAEAYETAVFNIRLNNFESDTYGTDIYMTFILMTQTIKQGIRINIIDSEANLISTHFMAGSAFAEQKRTYHFLWQSREASLPIDPIGYIEMEQGWIELNLTTNYVENV